MKLIWFCFLKEQFDDWWSLDLKGIVHPKMKFRVLIIYLFKAYSSFFLLLNSDEDVLKNTNTHKHTHWFPLYVFTTMEVNGCYQPAFYKISSLVFNRGNFKRTWGRISEVIIIFLVNYPFYLLNLRLSKM